MIASLLLDPLSNKTLLDSGPLDPYPFSPIPTSLFLASELMRIKFEEARDRSRVKGSRISSLLSRRSTNSTEATENKSGITSETTAEEELQHAQRRKERSEPGRIWRMRWQMAIRRGVYRFRERICSVTGLLCDEEGC